ncbi:MAG: hypothetical protein WC091_05815 [Sulfuricellaceae bacterium]
MLRQIVKPYSRHLMIDLPEAYVNQEIEVIAFPIKEGALTREEPTESVGFSRFIGQLKHSEIFNAPPLDIQKAMRDEWR